MRCPRAQTLAGCGDLHHQDAVRERIKHPGNPLNHHVIVVHGGNPDRTSCLHFINLRHLGTAGHPKRVMSYVGEGQLMFEGFEEFDVDVSGTSIHGQRGGDGPPVLLLHGIPETHVMWHVTAPRLAERFTVVATDLRGYGGSGTPDSDEQHAPYSMRSLVGRPGRGDAGTRVRELLSGRPRPRCEACVPDGSGPPSSVDRVAVLDIVPTGHAFNHADKDFSLGYWMWSFLAAPHPVPETLISRDPEVLVNHMLDEWSADPSCSSDEARQIYARQFRDPERLHAICEQYRAASTLDVEHNNADLGASSQGAPLLVMWSRMGPVEKWYHPLEVWRGWADHVEGRAVDGGHFLPEEAPDEIVSQLLRVA